jgi:enoyl-CoA hydratase
MRVMDLQFEALQLEQFARVVRITLNRPERRNAISRALQRELIAAVEACAQDASVHAVVIRGAGPAFCSGYDISGAEADAGAEPVATPRRAIETLAMARGWSRIWDAPVATIAQVHGACLAGGTDLALACDLVLAADDATIGFPALRMGGVPPTHMWLYHLGPQWTKRLLFTGDSITGRLAAQIGFALQAVPADQLDAGALALATRIAAMGRDIVAVNKHVINKGLDLMGRAVLAEISAPFDSIANQAPEMAAFVKRAGEIGLGGAFKERDAPFAGLPPLDVDDRD